MLDAKNDSECCPKFDPKPWQEKELVWKDKHFIKETIPQFMHIPFPGTFGKAVGRMWKKIEDAQAKPDMNDFIMLSTESSPWKGEIYIATTKEVPNTENVEFSGTYLTKVFDGGYNDVPKWIKEMAPYVAGKGKSVKKWFFYYTTCPKCAKKYGHNYVVTFAEV
ncbi:hydrolase [Chloroflexota bacterium]